MRHWPDMYRELEEDKVDVSSYYVVLLGLASAATVVLTSPIYSNNSCRVLPGDPTWPSTTQWANLNKTVNGHLIASVPESSVCHNSPFNDYNAAACAVLQSTWNETVLSHIGSPAEILSQNFQNHSYVPYTPESQHCELGNYVNYVVNVSGADDVRGAIAFARENNLLGQVDWEGRPILVDTHLKSTEYIPSYNASYYRGAAAKLGAGIKGFKAMTFAKSTGHTVVGGTYPTVGIAGGYSLGGGHSLLSSSYGMGSDNVLEWEVVTMDGSHLVAIPNQNSDLYWALSGGGGGTFAVVLSMTARIHPDGIVGGTILSFNDSVFGNDAYWEAVGAFHALLPVFLDAGNSFTYSIGNTALTA
ncbi:hypothetical protein MMC18_008013 [Xylographa bjoerkii]|nr:hypothetical protein [Xylographa bjoerkii]